MSESIGYNLRKFARKFTEFPLVEIKDKIINYKSIKLKKIKNNKKGDIFLKKEILKKYI